MHEHEWETKGIHTICKKCRLVKSAFFTSVCTIPQTYPQTSYQYVQADIEQKLNNLYFEIRGIKQQLKDISERQEAIWKDINTLISQSKDDTPKEMKK